MKVNMLKNGTKKLLGKPSSKTKIRETWGVWTGLDTSALEAGIQRRTLCVRGGEYIEYTDATEGSHMDGGDGSARHFPLSTFFCILKFSLVCINQPKIFVACECSHVIISEQRYTTGG